MPADEKYTCAFCRRKFVAKIRPPFALGQLYGRDGCRVERIGEATVFTCSRTLTGPGGSRFQGSRYACSEECFEKLTGRKPGEETDGR